MRKNMGIYRGQTKDGEWVEGYFAKTILSNGELIYEIRDIEEEHRLACYTEVLPETVGEWTGMKDKNGTKIFEGDIVSGRFGAQKIIGNVVYGSDGTFFIDRKGLYGIGLNNAKDWLEVIGNIHDNPELVKE